MKKLNYRITIISILLMTLMFFTACGNVDEQLTTNQQLTSDEEKQLTKEDFLNDFDYMMQTMEDTFPYFGVAERRLGVDIRALGRETRDIIAKYPHSLEGRGNELGISLEDMPELDQQIFWSIICHEFFSHFSGFAHTSTMDFSIYNMFQPIYSSSWSQQNTPYIYNAFTNPVSQRFYQEQESFYNTLAEGNEALFQFVFRGQPTISLPQSVTKTEIIEEDRIAYLNVSSFMGFNPKTMSTTLEKFYRDVHKYDHLIIDIRDNLGGTPDFWRMLIMKPLWPDRNMPDMPLYAFYKGSKLGEFLAEDNLKLEAKNTRYMAETDTLLKVGNIMESNNLQHINEEDIQDLDYGVKFNTSISNIELRHMQQIGFPNIDNYPFSGKVWLLTNGKNLSAASLFARHAKEMGFATLVGEETGGAYSTYMARFTLPNTGIILRWDIDYLTDGEGRSLNEFPTTPHHFNRPGMDALGTALQLIEEGNF
ncbi:S41 family peptidase [Alkaliphilus hydrothermalis]|uniref:Tail specific protease domain-containing protein n=1 Tax=Alkaliphilus hydrothermalis TaxID=1482730 RepID=A0ABS2NNE6_9FIRM|nr:S41 family peptidase [Alkaliphilus hydrothermalis]MBM7614455.1 hypothetical protein [Alkaliphilus hydrothermalis]